MHEQACYKKSFLKEVIVKIDFAIPIEKLEKSIPAKLVSSIVENFPIVEPTDIVMHEIAVEGSSIKSKGTAIKQWGYFTKDRNQQLVVSSQSAFVQYKRYNSYEETKEQFGSVIEALNAVFPGTIVSRFGLRYINQIDAPVADPTRWDEYFDQKLLCGRSFFEAEEDITRLITIAELKYDDIAVRFQFGMPNPDYPASQKRPLFVLDMDASISQAHELTDVLSNMDDAHTRIQVLFERSITQALREKMNATKVE
jgi:uncharacterized protein (TIGR04255 family)